MQTTDSSTREGTATVVHAEDQLTDTMDYDWSDAADNFREVRNRAGDTNQHLQSVTDNESNTQSSSHNQSAVTMNNSSDENVNVGTETSELTNKMFMQERQWAIDTARGLIPLEWLKAQLRPLFYLLY